MTFWELRLWMESNITVQAYFAAIAVLGLILYLLPEGKRGKN